MKTIERGPLLTFEVTWTNGHVERVQGHQCIAPTASLFDPAPAPAPRWTIHGEIDGKWQLILSARDEDIRTVRNLTHESFPA
jgi:hypothetical protein